MNSLQNSYVVMSSLRCITVPVFLETCQQNIWLDTTQTCPLLDRQRSVVSGSVNWISQFEINKKKFNTRLNTDSDANIRIKTDEFITVVHNSSVV